MATAKNNTVCGVGINQARGVGKVLRIGSYQDFDKVTGGEIVVTRNATPDFILILNRIKCLITDEGSVTCHIAIICRELTVPAIVATGNATQIFEDGRTVEFDTVKGQIWEA